MLDAGVPIVLLPAGGLSMLSRLYSLSVVPAEKIIEIMNGAITMIDRWSATQLL